MNSWFASKNLQFQSRQDSTGIEKPIKKAPPQAINISTALFPRVNIGGSHENSEILDFFYFD
jgi:hypothetical protein